MRIGLTYLSGPPCSTRSHARTASCSNCLIRGILLAGLFFTNSITKAQDTLQQQYTTPLDSPETRQRLGARFLIGGTYTSPVDDVSSHPIYGVRVGGLIPITANTDLIAGAEYFLFPGWSYETNYARSPLGGIDYYTFYTTVPDSRLYGLAFGFRAYVRNYEPDSLVASMSSSLCKLPLISGRSLLEAPGACC